MPSCRLHSCLVTARLGPTSGATGHQGRELLLSHLGGPQAQRHLGIWGVLFLAAEASGKGIALEQAAQLRNTEPAVLALPVVERRLGDAELAADLL
jgi:hypothetical protein